MTSEFSLGGLHVGEGHPCLIVAEIGQAHDGSLGACHSYIDAVATSGASAIKFQTHLAAEESTPAEPWRIRFSTQDATRYEYWQRMEFPDAAWRELADHARERELVFLSSPFSSAAVTLLEDLGIPAWKMASGEVFNLPLVAEVAATGKPVLLSSGMTAWADLDRAVDCVRAAGAPVGVFQTTTSYPCPPERLGLNVLAEPVNATDVRLGCPIIRPPSMPVSEPPPSVATCSRCMLHSQGIVSGPIRVPR